jgi:hypothetical protein
VCLLSICQVADKSDDLVAEWPVADCVRVPGACWMDITSG